MSASGAGTMAFGKFPRCATQAVRTRRQRRSYQRVSVLLQDIEAAYGQCVSVLTVGRWFAVIRIMRKVSDMTASKATDTSSKERSGDPPLSGITVLELAGVGPAPFGVMLLADLGADVIRVDRVTDTPEEQLMRPLSRGRRSIGVDIGSERGRDIVLSLAERSDVFVEPFRAGVAERLGLGPTTVHDLNPRLVYVRMSGYGQHGPLAKRAGHDINYLSITGALHAIGRPHTPPPPPLNIVADFAGGGLYLAVGVMAALIARERDGVGEVVDVAMVDGVASLTTIFHGLISQGSWTSERGTNLLDGGAPFYDTYATSDGRYVAVGAIEPEFYERLLHTLGLDPTQYPQQDRTLWPLLRHQLAMRFASRTREEWDKAFAGMDACVSPVLSLVEAPLHEHNVARGAFRTIGGTKVPAPAPRLSRCGATSGIAAPARGAHTDEVLTSLGIGLETIGDLRKDRVVG